MTMDNIKKGALVKGIRTFNGEEVIGDFQGYYSPTKKMKKNKVEVGIIYVEGERSYDVFPESIEILLNL